MNARRRRWQTSGVGLARLLGCDVYDPGALRAAPARDHAPIDGGDAVDSGGFPNDARDNSESDASAACAATHATCEAQHAISVCSLGACYIAECLEDFRDCDGDALTGCETPIDDAKNCGQCGRECALPNASADCAGGECVVVGCDPGYRDCDGPADGCETRTDSLAHCGGCDTPCGKASCAGGVCSAVTCSEPLADCDRDEIECETDLSSDIDHCGGCGNRCTTLLPHTMQAGCAAGRCEVVTCASGWADCDTVADNGCEHDLGALGACFPDDQCAKQSYNGHDYYFCANARTFDDARAKCMGPALWSAEPEVFAVDTPGGLGSHLDMLHSTRYCRGIAHVEENAYFVFNSDLLSLDRYDFADDHGPGNDDHADGVILRYVEGSVKGLQGVPSHLIYSPTDRQLYIADTGNARIAKLDTSSGTQGATFAGFEPAQRHYMDGATLVDVVPSGTLTAPSGIELHNDLLYVTDNATSHFHVFDLTGKEIRQLDTGLPAGSLAGFALGPADGKVYFTNLKDGRVYRIDPLP